MTPTPESAAAASLNQELVGRLWKKVGLAVSSAAMPFAFVLAPEVTGQLIKYEWAMWCLAAIGGLGLVAGTVKLHDRFRQNWGEFVQDGVLSTGLAAAATLGLVKTAEWNMAGDLMANGWIRAGEVGGGIAVGGIISTVIWDRWQERRSAAERLRIEAGRTVQGQAVREKVLQHRQGEAERIVADVMLQIAESDGAVTPETEAKIRRLAAGEATGVDGASENLEIMIEAAIRAGSATKNAMVDPLTGIINGENVAALARPKTLGNYKRK